MLEPWFLHNLWFFSFILFKLKFQTYILIIKRPSRLQNVTVSQCNTCIQVSKAYLHLSLTTQSTKNIPSLIHHQKKRFVGYFRTCLGSLACWRMLRHAGSRGCWDQTSNQFRCTWSQQNSVRLMLYIYDSGAAVETLEVKHQSDSEAWCSSVWFRNPQSEGELKLHPVFFSPFPENILLGLTESIKMPDFHVFPLTFEELLEIRLKTIS